MGKKTMVSEYLVTQTREVRVMAKDPSEALELGDKEFNSYVIAENPDVKVVCIQAHKADLDNRV